MRRGPDAGEGDVWDCLISGTGEGRILAAGEGDLPRVHPSLQRAAPLLLEGTVWDGEVLGNPHLLEGAGLCASWDCVCPGCCSRVSLSIWGYPRCGYCKGVLGPVSLLLLLQTGQVGGRLSWSGPSFRGASGGFQLGTGFLCASFYFSRL